MLKGLMSWSPAMEDSGQKRKHLTGIEKEAWNILNCKDYINIRYIYHFFLSYSSFGICLEP